MQRKTNNKTNSWCREVQSHHQLLRVSTALGAPVLSTLCTISVPTIVGKNHFTVFARYAMCLHNNPQTQPDTHDEMMDAGPKDKCKTNKAISPVLRFSVQLQMSAKRRKLYQPHKPISSNKLNLVYRRSQDFIPQRHFRTLKVFSKQNKREKIWVVLNRGRKRGGTGVPTTVWSLNHLRVPGPVPCPQQDTMTPVS